MPLLKQRRFATLLTFVALSGGVLRAALTFGRGWIGYDEANYLMIARNASAGIGYVQSPLAEYATKFHPLSYLVPQLLSKLTGDELFSSQLLFVIFGTASVALVGFLARELFGSSTGIAAACLAASAPVLTSLLVESISHSTFLPFFVGGLWLAWEGARHSRAHLAMVAGIAIGLTWWARADGLLIAPMIALFLLLAVRWSRGWKEAAKAVLAFLLGFSLLYGAYSLFVKVSSGGNSVTHSPLLDFLAFAPDCNASRDLTSYESLLSLALSEPQCIIAAVIQNLDVAPSVLFTWTGLPVILLPLVGAGWLSRGSTGRKPGAAHLLLICAFAPIVFYLPFYYTETRYIAPYATVAFIWAARGMVALSRDLRASLHRFAGTLVPLLVISFLLATTLLHSRRMEALGGRAYVEVGTWIDQHCAPDCVVLTSQAEIAFYARRPWSYPPPVDDLKEWIRLQGRSVWLVVDGERFFLKNKGWSAFLASLPEGTLQPIYSHDEFGRSVTTYDFTDWLPAVAAPAASPKRAETAVK